MERKADYRLWYGGLAVESGNTKKRIEYLDVAKGIAMIGVIIAHFGGIPFLLNRICFSFHMPLFF